MAKRRIKSDKVKYTFQNTSTSPRPKRANDNRETVVTLADVKSKRYLYDLKRNYNR